MNRTIYRKSERLIFPEVVIQSALAWRVQILRVRLAGFRFEDGMQRGCMMLAEGLRLRAVLTGK